MARPNRQAQRREDILTAAIGVIERHDLATLRIGDIAEEMRLTANAVRYYYKDVDALLVELAARSDDRFFHARRELIRTIDDPAEQLSRTIAGGLPTGPEDAEWRVIWRAVLAAGFELDRRTDVQAIYHRQVGLYADLLAAGQQAGHFELTSPPRDVALTLMSMEDYLGYRIVARDPDMDRATAVRLMVAYARLATGADVPDTV